MRLIILAAVAFFIAGCGNRTSLSPEESAIRYRITTPMSQHDAFLATEEALATAWNSYQNVNQLRQPETGTIIVKGSVPYHDETGGNYGAVSLRVKVVDKSVTLTGTFGVNKDQLFPSENGITSMRGQLDGMAAEIAAAVNGKLEPGG